MLQSQGENFTKRPSETEAPTCNMLTLWEFVYIYFDVGGGDWTV